MPEGAHYHPRCFSAGVCAATSAYMRGNPDLSLLVQLSMHAWTVAKWTVSWGPRPAHEDCKVSSWMRDVAPNFWNGCVLLLRSTFTEVIDSSFIQKSKKALFQASFMSGWKHNPVHGWKRYMARSTCSWREQPRAGSVVLRGPSVRVLRRPLWPQATPKVKKDYPELNLLSVVDPKEDLVENEEIEVGSNCIFFREMDAPLSIWCSWIRCRRILGKGEYQLLKSVPITMFYVRRCWGINCRAFQAIQ
jgi:hypothetical protein